MTLADVRFQAPEQQELAVELVAEMLDHGWAEVVHGFQAVCCIDSPLVRGFSFRAAFDVMCRPILALFPYVVKIGS